MCAGRGGGGGVIFVCVCERVGRDGGGCVYAQAGQAGRVFAVCMCINITPQPHVIARSISPQTVQLVHKQFIPVYPQTVQLVLLAQEPKPLFPQFPAKVSSEDMNYVHLNRTCL